MTTITIRILLSIGFIAWIYLETGFLSVTIFAALVMLNMELNTLLANKVNTEAGKASDELEAMFNRVQGKT